MDLVRVPGSNSGRLEGTPILNLPMPESSRASTALDVSQRPNSRNEILDDLWSRASKGDTAAYEKYVDMVVNYENDMNSREYAAMREDTYTQRLLADLRKAGISPYVLSGINPQAAASTFHSVSGSQMTSYANSKRSEEAQNTRSALTTVGSIIAALGLIIAHFI